MDRMRLQKWESVGVNKADSARSCSQDICNATIYHLLVCDPNEDDLVLDSDGCGTLSVESGEGIEHDELRARSMAVIDGTWYK